MGETLTFPKSNPIRLINNNGTFYLIQNNTLQGVTSPGILFSYGFEFKDAAAATAEDLSLPQGSLLLPNNGALIKSAEDKTVYLVSDGTRRAFTSAEVFLGLGFRFTSVLLVTNPEEQLLPKGSNIFDSSSAHLNGVDILSNGTIYWINNGTLYPYPSLDVYNAWHIDNDFKTVVPANEADLALPVGGVVETRTTVANNGSSSNNTTGNNNPPPTYSGGYASGGGGGGSSSGGSSGSTPDTTAPVISSVATSTPTATSLQITWTTDELSNSLIEYGTTTSYGFSTSSASMVTSHSLVLTGLATTTAYHFHIKSTDASSNTVTSADYTNPTPTYYVDSVNGNDSNSGLSPAQAVKTISRLQTVDASAPLNTWNLVTDSAWRETLTVPRDNMTVQSYGSGAKPLVDASDIISSSAWSLTAGTTNCYKAVLPSDNANPNQIWVFENGSRLSMQTSTSSCDSIAGSFYIGNASTTSPTIYVHATTGNPSSNGSQYEYTARARAVDSSKDGTRYIGLHARRVQANDGSIRAFTNAYISNCLSEESYSHQYYFSDGSLVTDSVAHNGGYGMYVLHPGSFFANGGSGEVRNSTAYNDSTTYVAGASSFISHTGGTPDTFGTVTVDNLTSDNMRGPAANEVSNFIIKNTTITNSPADSSSTACFQAGVGTTTISNSSCQMTNGGRALAGTNTTGEIISMSNVTLTGTGTAAYLSGTNAALTIASSTLIGGITMSGTGSSLSSRGNTWNSPTVNDGTQTIYSLGGVSVANFSADYNSYLGQNFKYVIATTTYYSLPTVRTVLSQELNTTPATIAQLFPSTANVDMTQGTWAVQGVGTRTANSFMENTQNLIHRVNYALGSYVKSQALYTVSAEVKPNGRTWAALSFISTCGSWVYFDIQNGTVGTTTGAAIPYATGISALDNGYYNIWASYYANSNSGANIFCLSTATGDGVNSFTGSSTLGIFNRASKLNEGGSPQ
ncbi:MAG: hypothetical protein HY918_00555 [Candidatus Doudnabacteria bacterium]|nr:hypothetical protein [Candidatus Doudnabacteria bacterium]